MRSDSLAYSKETRDRGVFRETTSNGIPIGPPSHLPDPKSAWTGESSPIAAISCAEFAATGSPSTRWFQVLLAGKMGQCGAVGSRRARADEPVRKIAESAAVASRRFIPLSSTAAFEILSAMGMAPMRRVLGVAVPGRTGLLRVTRQSARHLRIRGWRRYVLRISRDPPEKGRR